MNGTGRTATHQWTLDNFDANYTTKNNPAHKWCVVVYYVTSDSNKDVGDSEHAFHDIHNHMSLRLAI